MDKNDNQNGLFTKNEKGDILIVGSGDFVRKLKKKYSQHNSPYKQLYADQVRAICKNLPQEKGQFLLNQAGKSLF